MFAFNYWARVAELVDAEDLKSFVRKDVRVQVSSWAPIFTNPLLKIIPEIKK